MANGTGTTSYTYDQLNRLTLVTGPTPLAKTDGYRYDLDGNRTKEIYPDNRLSSVSLMTVWNSSRSNVCSGQRILTPRQRILSHRSHGNRVP